MYFVINWVGTSSHKCRFVHRSSILIPPLAHSFPSHSFWAPEEIKFSNCPSKRFPFILLHHKHNRKTTSFPFQKGLSLLLSAALPLSGLLIWTATEGYGRFIASARELWTPYHRVHGFQRQTFWFILFSC